MSSQWGTPGRLGNGYSTVNRIRFIQSMSTVCTCTKAQSPISHVDPNLYPDLEANTSLQTTNPDQKSAYKRSVFAPGPASSTTGAELRFGNRFQQVETKTASVRVLTKMSTASATPGPTRPESMRFKIHQPVCTVTSS